MAKKVVVISSSPRKGGNSDTLCDEFVKGAIDGGNEAVKYFLEDIEFGSCKACMACKTPERECFQEDEISIILDDMMDADVIVYATPIYYFSMTGTLKSFFDRCYPIFNHLENKDYYIITAAGSSNGNALTGIRDFIGFSQNPTEKAVFTVVGDVTQQDDIRSEVYEAGKNC
ncbi:flavodoxin family protein [uncultured Methanobrevibacter sp.]|uniref:flavodoxin family protein n=1 Tax=uncultured Methanobrevibacter sp. TaxID=253161 RepID=UPI0025E05945|nr:flavodoxin family protein [uncultured Methanobrevibacter sp.]